MSSSGGDKLTPQQRWLIKNPKFRWAVYCTYKACKRARRANVPFELNSKYVFSMLPDRCPIFGSEFKFSGAKTSTPESPTIDRLDPAKGYTKENIAVISLKANSIKNAYKSDDIIKVGLWLKQKGL